MAKCYLNETDSAAVREPFEPSDELTSGGERTDWRLSEGVFLRAGDAIHLVTASRAGTREEVRTNDRHLLSAAPASARRADLSEPYFPIQNVEKMRFRISSAVVAPVIASIGRSAP
jgi:hypothetical protein